MRGLPAFLDVSIHETAIVEAGAQIGAGTSVWHFAHIRAGATIGRRCMLGKDSYVGETAKLGDGVRVQNGVNVYNGVTLEDEVFVGPAVVFTNDLFPRAVNLVAPEMRSTVIRRGASLGAGSIIVCGISVGDYAMIGAGAVVVEDVPAYACVVGNPARQIGWSCRCGRPLMRSQLDTIYTCDKCRRSYKYDAGSDLSLNLRRLSGEVELCPNRNDSAD